MLDLTNRNSRINDDVRKIKSDFARAYRRLPEIILFVELPAFPKMLNNVRFSRKLLKITDDALFAEPEADFHKFASPEFSSLSAELVR